jgi:hypothetical protein
MPPALGWLATCFRFIVRSACRTTRLHVKYQRSWPTRTSTLSYVKFRHLRFRRVMDDRRHTLLATDKRLIPVTGGFSSRVDRKMVDYKLILYRHRMIPCAACQATCWDGHRLPSRGEAWLGTNNHSFSQGFDWGLVVSTLSQAITRRDSGLRRQGFLLTHLAELYFF